MERRNISLLLNKRKEKERVESLMNDLISDAVPSVTDRKTQSSAEVVGVKEESANKVTANEVDTNDAQEVTPKTSVAESENRSKGSSRETMDGSSDMEKISTSEALQEVAEHLNAVVRSTSSEAVTNETLPSAEQDVIHSVDIYERIQNTQTLIEALNTRSDVLDAVDAEILMKEEEFPKSISQVVASEVVHSTISSESNRSKTSNKPKLSEEKIEVLDLAGQLSEDIAETSIAPSARLTEESGTVHSISLSEDDAATLQSQSVASARNTVIAKAKKKDSGKKKSFQEIFRKIFKKKKLPETH